MPTFLAARKLSRIGMESDRSIMSTVEVRTSCSVCSTSKSSKRRTGRPPPVRRMAFTDRALVLRVEGVAELVGLGVVPCSWPVPVLELVAAHLAAGRWVNRSFEGRWRRRDEGHRRGSRGDLPVLVEARLLSILASSPDALEAVGGLVAEQLAHLVEVGLAKLPGLVAPARAARAVVARSSIDRRRGGERVLGRKLC